MRKYPMMIKNKKGWIMAEVITAMTVLGIVLIVFAATLHTFGRLNDIQLQKQRCISSAQAQLDSIALTGSPIPKTDFARLWPNVTTTTSIANGTGQWQGLKLVRAQSSSLARGRKKPVTIELTRYIVPKELAK
ncbi:MAG: hypothetical protein A2Y07_09355 [Planctomycetes bacterium GWF2_50_10]|nr:MAG: hypothetical protein A2Y07_09355 [Planctomycetes bacterium GWF2_50_10]